MNNRKPSQPIYAGIGTSSIILVFVVLCLTAFGVMSLISTRSSEQIMLRNTDYVCAYYNAAAEANEYIALQRETGIPGIYFESFPIDDELSVETEFEISNDNRLTIKRFCSVNTSDSELFDFE